MFYCIQNQTLFKQSITLKGGSKEVIIHMFEYKF